MSGYNTGFTFAAGGGTTSLTATQIGFGSGTNTLTGAPTLTYNSGTGVLTSSLGDAFINGVRVGIGAGIAPQSTVLGNGSLAAITTGVQNVAVGYQVMPTATSANYNVGVGYQTLNALSSGAYNVAIGQKALLSLIGGGSNIAIGNTAGNSATSASNNVFVGDKAGFRNVSGNNNVAIGDSSLLGGIGSFSNNTAVGARAGFGITTGATNIFLGYQSGQNVTSGNGNVIIGGYTGAAAPISATGSDYVVLSNGTGTVVSYFDGGATMYLRGSINDGTTVGTSGQVLTSNGTGLKPTWQTIASGSLTLANAAAVSNYFPTFSSVATGGVTTAYTNASYTFNPGTGVLTSPKLVLTSTGNGITFSSSYPLGPNNIAITNTDNGLNSSASVTLVTGTTPALTIARNSAGFNPTPSTFIQLNNMGYISAGSTALTLAAQGGINLAYGSASPAFAHSINNSGALVLSSSPTVTGSAGTSGQVLTSNGPSAPPTWTTPSAGSNLTLANAAVNATYYPTFSSVATGTVSTEYTNGSLTFNPGTGQLSTISLVATGFGSSISHTSSNSGAANFVSVTNQSNTASSSAGFQSTVTGGSTLSIYQNSASFNASPTTFLQRNNMAYVSGSGGLTLFALGSATSGVNLAYGTASAANAHTINSNGAILLGSTPTVAGNAGTAGQVLTSAGSGASVTWSNVSISGGAAGQVLYQSAPGVTSFTAAGTSGQVLVSNGTAAPTWTTLSSATVTTFSGGTTGLTPSTATSGAITLGGTLAIANGGTNSTAAPTAGAVPYGTGTAYAFTAAGTAGQFLQSNGAAAPTWAAAPSPTLTATQIAFGSVSNTVTSAATLTYNSSTGVLTSSSGDAVINGVRLGRGAGAVATNTALGATALNTNTTGSQNTAVGANALSTSTGSNNLAVGYNAGSSITTGGNNTIVGSYTGATVPVTASGSNWIVLADGAGNVPVYWNGTTKAMYFNDLPGTAGFVLTSNGSGSSPTWQASPAGLVFMSNTSNISGGTFSAPSISTGVQNSFYGYSSGRFNLTASGNTGVGYQALGLGSLTGNANTAVGGNALKNQTSAINNTAVGNGAGGSLTINGNNTLLGYNAGGNLNSTLALQSINNTFVGSGAGTGVTTGASNTFIGYNSGTSVTTGSNNVIIGGFNGSTSPITGGQNNWIVLSDGAGNIPLYMNGLDKSIYLNNGPINIVGSGVGTVGQALTSGGIGASPAWSSIPNRTNTSYNAAYGAIIGNGPGTATVNFQYSSTGVPQWSPNAGTVNVMYSGFIIKAGVQTVFNSVGTNGTAPTWYNLPSAGTTLTNGGDMCQVILSDTTNSRVMRVTFAKSQGTSNGTVIVENLV